MIVGSLLLPSGLLGPDILRFAQRHAVLQKSAGSRGRAAGRAEAAGMGWARPTNGVMMAESRWAGSRSWIFTHQRTVSPFQNRAGILQAADPGDTAGGGGKGAGG